MHARPYQSMHTRVHPHTAACTNMHAHTHKTVHTQYAHTVGCMYVHTYTQTGAFTHKHALTAACTCTLTLLCVPAHTTSGNWFSIQFWLESKNTSPPFYQPCSTCSPW